MEAGIPVVGIMTQSPEKLLMEAKATMLINNYEDPKCGQLWKSSIKRQEEQLEAFAL